MFKGDPRTTYFVLNQLRFMTGKNVIKRRRKHIQKVKAKKILFGNKPAFIQELVEATLNATDSGRIERRDTTERRKGILGLPSFLYEDRKTPDPEVSNQN